MNIKAATYAFSRMFLPTLTVIMLVLMWNLSPTKTFGFLLSDKDGAGGLRIVLMLAELAWFYYLYQKKAEEMLVQQSIDALNSEIKLDTNYEKYGDGSLVDLSTKMGNSLSGGNRMSSEACVYKKISDKLFLVKLTK